MNGVLNIIKPTGMTSSDVVCRVKRITGEKRCGHMGTLDPGATGVLPVGVGKSARLFDFFLAKRKKYRARFVFGLSTDTLDSYGAVTEREKNSEILLNLNEDAVRAALFAFRGEIEQLPPKYSALKVGGRKACDLARAGISAELKPRKVTIYSYELTDVISPLEYQLDIECSAGTYIRTLAVDLAASLGTVGYMSTLIRLSSGPFDIADGVLLSELEEQGAEKFLLPPYSVTSLQRLDVTDREGFKLANGVPTHLQTPDGRYNLFCLGEYYGICDVLDGIAHISVNMR